MDVPCSLPVFQAKFGLKPLYHSQSKVSGTSRSGSICEKQEQSFCLMCHVQISMLLYSGTYVSQHALDHSLQAHLKQLLCPYFLAYILRHCGELCYFLFIIFSFILHTNHSSPSLLSSHSLHYLPSKLPLHPIPLYLHSDGVRLPMGVNKAWYIKLI